MQWAVLEVCYLDSSGPQAEREAEEHEEATDDEIYGLIEDFYGSKVQGAGLLDFTDADYCQR